MRSRNFVDEELIKELDKIECSGDSEDIFPEHSFIASALKIGLNINDLKELTYVDVMKILISYIDKKSEEQKPTQEHINMLTG